MPKFSLSSLRSRAIALVLLAILPLLALTLYSYFDQRDRTIREVQRDELVAARNLATIQGTLISNTSQMLMSLARLPAVQRRDRDACNALFAELLKQSPHMATIVAADAEGRVFASAPAAPGPVSYADRPWFQKVAQTRGLVFGETVVGRISGKYGSNLAYPILDSDGRFQGALTCQLDLDWLAGLLAKSDFPPSTAMVLTDSSRKVLFRHPEPEKFLGKMLPEVFFKPMAAGDEGVAAGVGLPGDPRLFAFVRLAPPWQELWISIGLPRNWAVAPVNRLLWRNLVWLGLVALFAMAAAWYGGELFVVRPVRNLRGVTERLAAGDLTVRAGLDYTVGELGLLAHSFDQMAASLQEREAALKESQRQAAFLADLLESSAQPFGVGGLDGGLKFFNSAYPRMLGYSKEEFQNLDWAQDLTPPEWNDREQALLQELQRTGRPIHYEKEYFRKDGSRVPVELFVQFRRAEQGQPALYYAFISDITERKRAEASLRESEERLRLFIEHAPASLAMFDNRMRYLSVSRRWLNDYGLTDRNVIGRSHYEVFPETGEQWQDIHRRGLAGEVVQAEADRFARPDGSVQWLRWEVRPWYDASGGIAGIVIFTEDITARRRQEEQLHQTLAELERSNRELEEFAYISSHDLQEPLRKIANFSEMLAQQYRHNLDERALRYFGYISDGARRMQTLINDLLNYSRVGRAELRLIPASLEDILKGTRHDLHALIKESHAEISHDPLPTLKVNPPQMGQLLQNLFTNAIKFRGDQPPRIHLSARQEGPDWLISVRDNGIGFDSQFAESIFKVFKRLHAKEEYPGTGIGLAICKKIVERHGGRIWAESEPGRGATFYFTIPA